MPEYEVSWRIDIDAGSPQAAARRALAYQRNPASEATVFDVRWVDTLGDAAGTEVTSLVTIDLTALDGGGFACPVCRDRHWLIMATNGDETRAWVERCDECAATTHTDRQAAELAAQALRRRVGWARPHGVDRSCPYLKSISLAHALTRAGQPR
jgi:hypothetical protein